LEGYALPASDTDPAPPPLRLHLFGPFEVFLNDRPLPRLRSRKSQWLLAILALKGGADVEREWLTGLLWPERIDRQALRNCLTELRHALGTEAGRVRSPTGHSLSLDLTGAVVDALAFDAAIVRGDAASLTDAVALYRGPLLEGCAEEWAFEARERREQAYLAALARLAEEARATGEWGRAEGYLRRAASADPLRDSVQRALMEVLAAQGNHTTALRLYRELQLRLQQELKAEPDSETHALFERLREEARSDAAAQAPRHPAFVTDRPLPGAAEPEEPAPQWPAPQSRAARARDRERTRGVALEGENRLVTVLVAAMRRPIQATRDRGPEEAAAFANDLLRGLVDAIDSFGGTVDHFVDHGVLALFGTPRAHEDDPERAIRAALASQDAARRLSIDLAVGIDTGEVYLGALGSERHQEVTVAGPAVSLASWLQERAEPCQILVGERTWRQTRGAFQFSCCPLAIEGQLEADGPLAPVTAFSVAQARTHPVKTRGIEGSRAEMIGRDNELASLSAAVAAVARGQGRIIAVIGEAGVGKSRLVSELKGALGSGGHRRAAHVFAVARSATNRTSDAKRRSPVVLAQGSEHPCRPGDSREGGRLPLPVAESPMPGAAQSPEPPLWLEGRSLEWGTTAGYSVFVDLLRGYLAWGCAEQASPGSERLAEALNELQARGDLLADRGEEIRPLLDRLISADFDMDRDPRLSHAGPEQIHHQTCFAVRDFLVALSRRRPLLLVLEDLHWADSLSLNLISLLMESVPLAPIGLLCVYRPETEHRSAHLATIAERKCPGRLLEIRLRALTEEQSSELVASLLPIERLPGRLKEHLLKRSEGNPFFLEELVRSLIDSRLVYREGERWQTWEGIESISLPESVQALISSRFDRLPAGLRQVLRCAAVIGALFRSCLLERVLASEGGWAGSESGDRSLEAALRELEAQGLIYEARVVPETEYAFKHVLMQEAIYQRILRSNRARLHQRVAEALEAQFGDRLAEYYELLAYHYEESAADEKAIEFLLKAGEKARRAYLNVDAIAYFRRALQRIERQGDRAPARLEALRGLGAAYQAIGRHAEAEEAFRTAVGLGRRIGLEPRELARLSFRLGETLIWQRRAEELIGPAEEVLALLGEGSESVETALMNEMTAMGYRWRGDRERYLLYTRRNARFLLRLPYSEELRLPYTSVLTMYWLEEDNLAEAMRWARCLEVRARGQHDLSAVRSVLEFRSTLLEFAGHVREAAAPLQQALDLCRKTGELRPQYLCHMRMRRIFLTLGELCRAEACALQQFEDAEALDDPREIVVSLVAIGAVSLCRGRWDEAQDAYRQAARAGGEASDLKAWVAYVQGLAWLTRCRRAEAREALQAAACLHRPEPLHLVDLLSGLEEAYDDAAPDAGPSGFQAFCRQLRDLHGLSDSTPLAQWYLKPAGPSDRDLQLSGCDLASEGWTWCDPLGDCSFTLQDGLEIRAANGRDLCYPNRSAPRLLRPVTGDVAVQVACHSAVEGLPALGGLLLWKDRRCYLRLDWGVKGPHQLSVGGCLPGHRLPEQRWLGKTEVILGRGRLVTDRILLRLERRGDQVRALCSADGRRWFLVGQTEFPAGDALQVGLHAIGAVHRRIYPGAYPEGTAIRFESLALWT
jgi:adenylate cyclase